MQKISNNTKRADEVLDKTVDILVKNLNPKTIMLFGSRAKKNFFETTDFDLAVDAQAPDINSERKIMDKINDVSGLYKVDVVYFSNLDDDFKNIVLKTGKQIYEKRRN